MEILHSNMLLPEQAVVIGGTMHCGTVVLVTLFAETGTEANKEKWKHEPYKMIYNSFGDFDKCTRVAIDWARFKVESSINKIFANQFN